MALSAGVAEAVPTSPFLPTREPPSCCLPCLSAVCRSAATASPPVRAGLHAPLPVKAAERSGAPGGPGLDREWYTGCARTGGSFFLQVLVQDMSSTYIALICASNFRHIDPWGSVKKFMRWRVAMQNINHTAPIRNQKRASGASIDLSEKRNVLGNLPVAPPHHLFSSGPESLTRSHT